VERIVAVIPARMGSSRFPGKPLAACLGRPMIEHVVRRAMMCEILNAVYVATCDLEIGVVAKRVGAGVVMTSPRHERATDRTAEACEQLDADIVVMIQGDEPMIAPAMITETLDPMLENHSIGCVNLVHLIASQEEYLDPNTIKVVQDVHGDALYFSRSPIPSGAFDGKGLCAFKQVCVIPFRRETLLEFARLEPTPLECAESIDMLRILEHGGRVRLVETRFETHSVDTPEDLQLVESRMRSDPLITGYL
jgi:3-deoxy-manno-octulosonate cytidylyltransferase (CMP-KDO synthetase)